MSLNYNGLVGRSVSLEGQYSRRTLEFVTSGAAGTDLINDTLLIDRSLGGTANATGPRRSARATSTSATITRYCSRAPTSCQRAAPPTASSSATATTTTRERPRTISRAAIIGSSAHRASCLAESCSRCSRTPASTSQTIIQYDPIVLASLGSNIRTHGLFVNDAWRFNTGITLNLGVRWDKNHGKDAAGNLIATGNRFSPRLGVAWDPANDGRWSVTGSFARYVSSLNNGITEQSPAGSPASYQWNYEGPPINVGGATVATPDAIRSGVRLVRCQRRHQPHPGERFHPRRQFVRRRVAQFSVFVPVRCGCEPHARASAATSASTTYFATTTTSTSRAPISRPELRRLRTASSSTSPWSRTRTTWSVATRGGPFRQPIGWRRG